MLKVVFIGGGSFRLLPIIRAAMAHKKIFNGGEVRLYDLNAVRAETMGRMLMKSPEYAAIDCTVSWGDNLDRALDGADAVNVVLPVGSPLVCRLSDQASSKHGFMSSDQLSPSGAMRSLTGGRIVLGFARKMEKLCPKAWMMIFANPVAVYSGLVNSHTSIKAMGICQGYMNHMWDLTRLMGRDEMIPDYDVEVAGINHLSYILRGKYQGQDLFETLETHFTKGWRPPRIQSQWKHMEKHIQFGLRKLIDLYQKFGVTIFSTEGDGMCHLYYEEMFEKNNKNFTPQTRSQINASIRNWRIHREEADARFRELAAGDLDADFWNSSQMAATAPHDITVKILKGLAGVSREKIVTSHLNNGAVDGFKANTVLEYSQTFHKGVLKPYGKLAIPDALHGLISALATHQTLLGDAIATEDPLTLYQALYAYPIKQNSSASRAMYKDLLKVHADEIPAAFQKTRDYL